MTQFMQTLAVAVDTRTDTLLADLLTLFKKHARIDFADDDELCTMYLASAISRIEQWAEMPIKAAAYSWDIDSSYKYAGNKVLLPFRNCTAAGEQFGFELLSAPKLVQMPESWPMHLEVGFSAGTQVPLDLKAGIFQLALALYELRSNPEMVDVYAQEVMNGSLARYKMMRV